MKKQKYRLMCLAIGIVYATGFAVIAGGDADYQKHILTGILFGFGICGGLLARPDYFAHRVTVIMSAILLLTLVFYEFLVSDIGDAIFAGLWAVVLLGLLLVGRNLAEQGAASDR